MKRNDSIRIESNRGHAAFVIFPHVSFVEWSRFQLPSMVVILVLLLTLDRLLGWLAGWGIAKTPKAFRWNIERICIRPSAPWSSRWSEIIVVNWVGLEGLNRDAWACVRSNASPNAPEVEHVK